MANIPAKIYVNDVYKGEAPLQDWTFAALSQGDLLTVSFLSPDVYTVIRKGLAHIEGDSSITTQYFVYLTSSPQVIAHP
ncbi:hypothetical protein [Pseudomonas sp. W5-01]|uniref:hypothetical protein n=1 Tax=Pseudomonas sp. W5-01 TaxID=3097454 RepID=UPI003977E4D1